MMIKVIEGVDRNQHSKLLDQMFRMRAAVFSGRLGWEVSVENGREVDAFDHAGTLYLLSVGENTGKLHGAVRLLPTTGPNMLRDVFPALTPDGVVESQSIWESSRFAVNPSLASGSRRNDVNRFVNQTTFELLCGIVDVGQSVGIEHVVSVFDRRMARIFRAIGCHYRVVGVSARIGRVMTYAGLFEISDAMRERLIAAGKRQQPADFVSPMRICVPSSSQQLTDT
jgi:acyl homoserine lactone synthase